MDLTERYAGHTLGPWRLFIAHDAQPHSVFLRPRLGSVCVPHYGYDDPTGELGREMTANAALIAAAPDLLAECVRLSAELAQAHAALQHIIRRLEMDINDGGRPDQWSMEDLVRTARAALAPEQI